MKKIFQSKSCPLLRPGLKDKQANYWIRTSFPILTDYNGLNVTSRYYTKSVTPDLRSGHRAVDIHDGFARAPEDNVFALLHVNSHPDIEGITELPLAVTTSLGAPIDINYPLDSLAWDYALIPTKNPAKDLAETIFFNEFLTSSLGSVSFLGDLGGYFTDLSISVKRALESQPEITALVLDLKHNISSIVKAPWSELADKHAFVLLRTPLKTAVMKDGAWDIKEEPFIFLASTRSFVDFKQNLQYTSSFFAALQHNPMLFFPDDNYKRQLVKRARKLCTYWGGLAEILDFTQISPQEIPDLNFIEVAKNSPGRLTNAQLAALSADSVAYDTTEGKVLSRLKTAYEDVATEVAALEVQAMPNQIQLKRLQNLIALLDKQVNVVRAELEKNQSRADILQKEYEEQNSSLVTKLRIRDSLAPKLEQAARNFTHKIVEVRQELRDNPTDFELRLQKLGIIITDATLRTKHGKTELPLVGNEDLLDDDAWYLGRLNFITTHPHTIYVDRLKLKDKAPIIIGGPYEVNLSYFYDETAGKFTKPQMFLRLASIDAVFGKFKKGLEWKAKIHPHTQPSPLAPNIPSLTRFVENAHNVCLGEAESVISEGFRSKDIWVVISACLSWITSANTENLANAAEADEFGAA
jgi:hypothetical protein